MVLVCVSCRHAQLALAHQEVTLINQTVSLVGVGRFFTVVGGYGGRVPTRHAGCSL